MTSRSVQWVGFLTILRREITRVLRIWPQTILPSVITTTLYFLIFGKFFGEQIQINKFNYIEFIAPGLIMMSTITTSYGNVVSSFFGSKFQRNIEELMVSPLNPSTILLGFLAGGLTRGLMVGTVVSTVSLLFCPLNIYNIFLIVVTLVMTSFLFSMLGFVNAMFANKFDDISIIPTFVLTPMTYLGGVFYSLDRLPEFWQKLSLLNPVLYLINIFRYGFLGITDISVMTSFCVLIIICTAFWFFCLYLLKTGKGLVS